MVEETNSEVKAMIVLVVLLRGSERHLELVIIRVFRRVHLRAADGTVSLFRSVFVFVVFYFVWML